MEVRLLAPRLRVTVFHPRARKFHIVVVSASVIVMSEAMKQSIYPHLEEWIASLRSQ
jgi:hypothetical protein